MHSELKNWYWGEGYIVSAKDLEEGQITKSDILFFIKIGKLVPEYKNSGLKQEEGGKTEWGLKESI
jgi:hypothetical protein